MFNWDIESIAQSADSDFMLTHEELMAIFMAHVPTTGEYYAEIKSAFEEKLETIDLDAWNEEAREKIERGVRKLTFDIDLDVQIPGTVTDVPVTVTTNIDVKVTEGGNKTNYVIDHEVKINGELVKNPLPDTVKYTVDEITGELESWFDSDPVINPKDGDYIDVDFNGSTLSGKIVDDPSDPSIGERQYQLWAVASDRPIKDGDSINSFQRHPLGINVFADGNNFSAISPNKQAVDLLNGSAAFTGIAIIDFGSQTVSVVDEV